MPGAGVIVGATHTASSPQTKSRREGRQYAMSTQVKGSRDVRATPEAVILGHLARRQILAAAKGL